MSYLTMWRLWGRTYLTKFVSKDLESPKIILSAFYNPDGVFSQSRSFSRSHPKSKFKYEPWPKEADWGNFQGLSLSLFLGPFLSLSPSTFRSSTTSLVCCIFFSRIISSFFLSFLFSLRFSLSPLPAYDAFSCRRP